VHTNRGAKRARLARERSGLDTTSPVACLLTLVDRDAGLPVVVGALDEDVAGALVRNGTGAVAFVNASQWVARQRFTLAHELGHAFIGHEQLAPDTTATIAGSTHVPEEIEANAFAAAFLAPPGGVRAMVEGEPNLEDVVRVGAHFGISAIAALYRFVTLDLVGAKRAKLLRREIDARLRMAKRQLTEHAAELAVKVAEDRIRRTITPEDQLRLVDRYAAQLREAR
jgi:Zn-dependent peptidase ImmA (M78 family)